MMRRPVLALALLAFLGTAAAGCGAGPTAPGLAGAKGRGPIAARNDGFEKPVVLEDFDTLNNDYEWYGPSQGHPFFSQLDFTKVPSLSAGSNVVEVLAAHAPKPAKGFILNEDVENGGFTRGEGDKLEIASQARVLFKWGNNPAAVSDPCLFMQVAFQFESKRLGQKALIYAWSNRYAPGTVLAGQIGNGDDAIPARIIVLENGPGLGQPCGEASLNKIPLVAVSRNFPADVRWAYAESTKVTEPGMAADNVPNAPAAKPYPDPPAQFVTDPATGKPLRNTDLMGIIGLGFGADVVKGVCAHAIADDVALQVKWRD